MAPFWNMVFLAAAYLAANIYVYFSFYRQFAPEVSFLTTFKGNLPEFLILVAEAALYWFVKNWKIRKLLIWLHIGSIYIILLGMPVLYIFFSQYIFGGSTGDPVVRALMSNTKAIVNTSLIIAGHIFLAVAIIDGYKNKRRQHEPEFFETL